MKHTQIAKMHAGGKTPTCTHIVVDFRPQKSDPNRACITAGGNLIKCLGKLTTRTADITTTKIIWNSIISTKGARYGCLGVGDFYLETSMEKNQVYEDAISLVSRMDMQAIHSRQARTKRLSQLGNLLGDLWTT